MRRELVERARALPGVRWGGKLQCVLDCRGEDKTSGVRETVAVVELRGLADNTMMLCRVHHDDGPWWLFIAAAPPSYL